MNETTAQLDAIKARTAEDRKDFIDGGYYAGSDVCIEDREFLLDLARKQQAALDAVKALHVAVDVEVFDNPTTNSSHIEWMCGECDTCNYPCPTMEALEGVR